MVPRAGIIAIAVGRYRIGTRTEKKSYNPEKQINTDTHKIYRGRYAGTGDTGDTRDPDVAD